MTKMIHKYTVPVDDDIHLFDLPKRAEIIRVGSQFNDAGKVHFWAVVDPDTMERRSRYFKVVGTGHPWPAGGRYVGSADISDGTLVWHLLEVNR